MEKLFNIMSDDVTMTHACNQTLSGHYMRSDLLVHTRSHLDTNNLRYTLFKMLCYEEHKNRFL